MAGRRKGNEKAVKEQGKDSRKNSQTRIKKKKGGGRGDDSIKGLGQRLLEQLLFNILKVNVNFSKIGSVQSI